MEKEKNNNYGKTRFEGEYVDGKRWNGKGYNNKGNLEFEKNIILMRNQNMKDNIRIIKKMEMEKNLIKMVN